MGLRKEKRKRRKKSEREWKLEGVSRELEKEKFPYL